MNKLVFPEFLCSNLIPKRSENLRDSIRYGYAELKMLCFPFQFLFVLQLYIKARGLTDAIRKRFENAVPNLSNKVRTLLDTLKLPVVATTPLHLEVIVQIEGKSVVSYFLNEKTFANLTDGDRKYNKKVTNLRRKFDFVFVSFSP